LRATRQTILLTAGTTKDYLISGRFHENFVFDGEKNTEAM
jgi:hypothetical protein